jgi:phosphatidylserine/phosphatidylglycerophosphate/cardiolipin synthase-like enzyme
MLYVCASIWARGSPRANRWRSSSRSGSGTQSQPLRLGRLSSLGSSSQSTPRLPDCFFLLQFLSFSRAVTRLIRPAKRSILLLSQGFGVGDKSFFVRLLQTWRLKWARRERCKLPIWLWLFVSWLWTLVSWCFGWDRWGRSRVGFLPSFVVPNW